jgi:chromosome segregation ATPase
VWKDEKAAEIEECERQRGHYQHLSEIRERELKSLQSELDRLQRQLDAAEAELGTAKLSIASLEASRAVTPPNGDDGTTEAEAAVQDCEPVIWSGADLSQGISLRARRRISRVRPLD